MLLDEFTDDSSTDNSPTRTESPPLPLPEPATQSPPRQPSPAPDLVSHTAMEGWDGDIDATANFDDGTNILLEVVLK